MPIAIPLIIAAVAAIASGISVYQQQQAANKRNKYMAEVARNNAKIAKYEAAYVKQQAAKKAAKQGITVAKFLGKQRAAMGASGVVVDEGTFLDILLDTTGEGRSDQLAILYEGDIAGWRHEMVAGGHIAQAGLHDMAVSSPLMPAFLAMSGSAATSGMQMYSSYDGSKPPVSKQPVSKSTIPE